jgi:hypothetical protein
VNPHLRVGLEHPKYRFRTPHADVGHQQSVAPFAASPSPCAQPAVQAARPSPRRQSSAFLVARRAPLPGSIRRTRKGISGCSCTFSSPVAESLTASLPRSVRVNYLLAYEVANRYRAAICDKGARAWIDGAFSCMSSNPSRSVSLLSSSDGWRSSEAEFTICCAAREQARRATLSAGALTVGCVVFSASPAIRGVSTSW